MILAPKYQGNKYFTNPILDFLYNILYNYRQADAYNDYDLFFTENIINKIIKLMNRLVIVYISISCSFK